MHPENNGVTDAIVKKKQRKPTTVNLKGSHDAGDLYLARQHFNEGINARA
jgi:hypothetical protein